MSNTIVGKTEGNADTMNGQLPLVSKLRGVFTAIITPFSEDTNTIDYASIDVLLEQQIKAGVAGVVIAGSTGEAATLSDVEYSALIRYIVERAEGRLSCIAGVNSSSTAKAVELAIRASDSGAEGLLVVSPPYNKPTQEGVVKHFESIFKSTHKPIVAYNVPGRAVSSLSPQTLSLLAVEGIIVALKESSGSVDNCIDIIAAAPSLPIFSGDDSLVLPIMSLGGVGAVAVSSNVAPASMVRLCELAARSEFEKAKIIHFELLGLFRAMFMESNPIPVKAALKLKGLIKSSAARLPLTDALPTTVARIEELFAQRSFE